MKRVKVILNDDVYNLGEEGDVREVAPGYARNFLIPKGLAFDFSKKNIAQFEQRKEAIERRKEEKRDAAKGFKEKIESQVIELEMPAGNTGKLFGSVNSATIAEKLAAEGIAMERKKIEVPESSIKMVGVYDIRIRLYGDEVAVVKVVVNPVGGAKKEAAEAGGKQKRKGEAKPPKSSPLEEAAAEEEAAMDEESADGEEEAAKTE